MAYSIGRLLITKLEALFKNIINWSSVVAGVPLTTEPVIALIAVNSSFAINHHLEKGIGWSHDHPFPDV